MDVANTLIPSEKFKTTSRSVCDVEPGGSIIKNLLALDEDNSLYEVDIVCLVGTLRKAGCLGDINTTTASPTSSRK
jgi:hypothetical protein